MDLTAVDSLIGLRYISSDEKTQVLSQARDPEYLRQLQVPLPEVSSGECEVQPRRSRPSRGHTKGRCGLTLVMSFSGLAHTSECRAKGKKIYRVVNPDIELQDVGAFLRVRRLQPCRTCLRDVVVED